MNKTTKHPYLLNVRGKLYARATYQLPNGQTVEKRRRINNPKDAARVAGELRAELLAKSPQRIAGDRMLGKQLLQAYTRPFPKAYAALFGEHFGERLICRITPEDLTAFKRQRDVAPKRFTKDTPRSVATVNREMQAINRLFMFAKKRGWLQVNPFDLADDLIETNREESRMRLPTSDEIERLLAGCVGPRLHLKAIILIAMDTGLRRSKILGITESQIDWNEGLIKLGRPAHRNKKHPPYVAMTKRVQDALREWLAAFEDHCKSYKFTKVWSNNGAIFPIKAFKRSWSGLCADCGIEDLHFHDLRHWYATQAILAGLPKDLVMKQTGHSTEVFDRYLNLDAEIAKRTAAALERARAATA